MGKLLLESLSYSPDSCLFATFTYNDESVPVTRNGELTLNKTDGRLFRQQMANWNAGQYQRFYWCGEYGSANGRPHYHAVFFGVTPKAHRLLNKAWKKGFTEIAYLNPARAAYICKYILKHEALPQRENSEHREERLRSGRKENENPVHDWEERHPQFAQMSRRPGLGDLHVKKIGDWYNTRHGKAKLSVEKDVSQVFRFEGKIYPFNNRHVRMMRKMAGLPELRGAIEEANPELVRMIEVVDFAEQKNRQVLEDNFVKRKKIYAQKTRSL